MRRLAVSAGLALVFWLTVPLGVGAQQQRLTPSRTGSLTLGIDWGFQGGTADGTAFAVGLSGDYFVDHNFSIGPLLQIGVTDDLFQIAPTAQAKFTFDLISTPELKPHLQGGIGFIHAALDRRGRPDRHDTSFLIPLGFGAEYRLSRDFSVGTSLLFNFTDLERVRDENFFVTWLVGLRAHF